MESGNAGEAAGLEGLSFSLAEAEFQRSLLPAGCGDPGSASFREAVTAFFEQAYRSRGGRVAVSFQDGRIEVQWSGEEEQQDAHDRALALIEQGRRPEARTLLEALVSLEPRNAEALYNLGLLCSDAGELEQAAELLERCVAVDPDDANAWVALGVAGLRAQALDRARPALERAVELDPRNPYALRSYGTLLLMQDEPREAASVLQRALAALPDDPTTLLTLAQALIAADVGANAAQAEELLQRVLSLAPRGDLAERARRASQQIADHNLRRSQGEGLRADVVAALADALRIYGGLTPAQRQALLVEVAGIGNKGLPVNQTGVSYQLETMQGRFTALQVAGLIEVGARQVLGMADGGFGFAAELEEAARRMQGAEED